MPLAPLCGNVGQVPCFCDNEAFLAYSSQPLVCLGLRFALRLVIVVSVGFALVVGLCFVIAVTGAVRL